MTDYDSMCELVRRQTDLLKEKDREIKVLKEQTRIVINRMKRGYCPSLEINCGGHCGECWRKWSLEQAEKEIPK